MCGIFATNKIEINTEIVKKNLDLRGPDDFGFYKNKNFLLCQSRLSIIDLSIGGHQPMWNFDKSIGIIFNGEIYNYKYLKKELESVGIIFESNSDTEVILKGFEKYGQEYFNKLQGMWAFIIYDVFMNKIIISRDHFGIKPLYKYFKNGEIFFSSDVKTILEFVPKPTINTEKYFLFYNLGYFPGRETTFNEIEKVLPGSVLEINLETFDVKESFLEIKIENKSKIENFEESVDLVERAIKTTIEKHYISDVPVGVLLSGGTDSSLIAAISKKIGKNPICYNISIPGSLDNDYAEKIANYLGLQFNSLKIGENEFKNQYEEVLNFLDQPSSDVSLIPTSLVYKMIKGKSKVVLSGEGGDELFGGYDRHNEFAKYREIESKSFILKFPNLFKFSLKNLNPIYNKFRNVFLKYEGLTALYSLKSRQIDIGIKQGLFLKYLFNFYNNHPYKNNIQNNLFYDFFLYLPFNLLYKGDSASMNFSVEARVPFVDKQFLTNISKISDKFRLSIFFKNKVIFKKVLEKYLPHDLVYRPKSGFGIKIGKFGKKVEEDLKEAMQFHLEHNTEFDVKNCGLTGILNPRNSKIILDKYPRFAFAIITNYKVNKKYL